MSRLREHQTRTLGGLIAVAFVLFMCSGIPALKNATHGVNFWLGNVCWFGFLLTALAFVVTAVYAVVQRNTHARGTM